MAILYGVLTLPGAALSLLPGCIVDLLARYVPGAEDRRARGVTLVRTLCWVGIDTICMVRMDRAPEARVWVVITDAPLSYTGQVRERVYE